MSTEVKEVDSKANGAVDKPEASNAATSSVSVSTPPEGGTWLSVFERRRNQVVVAAAAVVLVAGVTTYNLVGRQYTPDGAVRQYLAALQSGDGTGAWNEIEVSAPTQPAAVSLVGESALNAALASGRPDIRSFDITSVSTPNAGTAIVDFTYSTEVGSKQAKFVVARSGQTRFGVFPVWQIVITPTLLQLTVPNGGEAVSIDGQSVALPAGPSTVAVLPLPHKIAFGGTSMLEPETVTVDASFSPAQTVSRSPKLTAAGAAAAKSAVKAYFAKCAAQVTPAPDSTVCPQRLSSYLNFSGQWHLVADPTTDLTLSLDKDANLTGGGHFQMVFAYQENGYPALRHEPSAGAYAAALALSKSDITVSSITAGGSGAQLGRPAAATDDAIKAILGKAFTQCAAVRSQYVADCPQQLVSANVSNVRWTLTGDPLSGATIVFDASSGLITVHGNFQMSASYQFFSSSNTAQSFVNAYNAYMFWDGQALQLVTIDGSTS